MMYTTAKGPCLSHITIHSEVPMSVCSRPSEAKIDRTCFADGKLIANTVPSDIGYWESPPTGT